jgi:hypothetical protein
MEQRNKSIELLDMGEPLWPDIDASPLMAASGNGHNLTTAGTN